MNDRMTKISSFDSNLGRVVNARQSLFQCVSASGPEHCDGCAAKCNHHLCEEIQLGFDCAEGEVFILKNSTPAFIQKWMGYFINQKGELDCMTWDHNHGHLAHAFVVNVPVPRQVQEDYLTRPTCLTLDKFGRPG